MAIARLTLVDTMIIAIFDGGVTLWGGGVTLWDDRNDQV